jgi:hypothetical protein
LRTRLHGNIIKASQGACEEEIRFLHQPGVGIRTFS